MDLALIQTFLELEQAGTMTKASERLHLTQATVSVRVAQLEEQLKKQLFVRNKSGTKLTTEGRTFLPHAKRLMEDWQAARASLNDVAGSSKRLSIGGEYTLSTALLVNWLVALKSDCPDLSVRTEVDSAERLLDAAQAESLDVVTLYSPLRRAKLRTRLVLQEELVCITTHCDRRRPTVADYVYVDWGPDFRAQHDRALPELSQTSTCIGLGPLGLRYLLRVGGSGYFRTRAVRPYLRAKQLHLVQKMPKFSYSIYAASRSDADSSLVDWAIDKLTSSAKQIIEPWV